MREAAPEGTNPGIEAPRRREPREPRGESRGDAREPRGDLRGDRPEREPRPLNFEPDDAYANLFVSIGKRDNVRVVDLLRLFETHAGLGKDALGRIRIRDRHSFVAVPKDRAEETIAKLVGLDYQGRPLSVEVAKAEQRDGDVAAPGALSVGAVDGEPS